MITIYNTHIKWYDNIIMGEAYPSEVITGEHIHRVFDGIDTESATLTDENGQELTARGFGETFLLSKNDGSALQVMQLTEIPMPDQEEDVTLDFVKETYEVKEQLYVGGYLTGGITEDGQFVAHLYSLAPVLEQLEQAKEQADRLMSEGLKEIFWPVTETEAYRQTSIQRLSNFVLARLLQLDPSMDIDDLRHVVSHDLSRIRPKFERTIDEQTFYMSHELFSLEGNRRPFIFLYADIDKPPTLFYKSQSHGVWRALLALDSTGWHAKGMKGGEHSVDATIDLQHAFATIGSLGSHVISDDYYTAIPDQVSSESHAPAIERASSVMTDAGVWGVDYYSQSGNILSKGQGRLFKDSKRPDIAAVEKTWTDVNTMYGEVTYTSCLSRDGSIRYLLCEAQGPDGKKHSWVGSIEEPDVPVSKLGIKQWAPALPDAIAKPAIDYERVGDELRYGEIRAKRSRFELFLTRSRAKRNPTED